DAQVEETVRLEKQKLYEPGRPSRINRTIRETEIIRNQDAQVEETVRLEKQKLYEPGRPSRRNRTIRETEIVRNQDAQVKETVRLEKQKLYETRTPKSKKPYDLRDRNCTIPVKAVTRPSIVYQAHCSREPVCEPTVREKPFASPVSTRNSSRKGAYIGLEVQDISDPDESYEEKHSEKEEKGRKTLRKTPSQQVACKYQQTPTSPVGSDVFPDSAFAAGGQHVPVVNSPADIYQYCPRRLIYEECEQEDLNSRNV
ncbi:hypothetical protein OS493_038754, partial [Desmophyllum pertusum]